MSAENPSNVKLKYKKFYQVRKLVCKNVKEQMAFDLNTQLLGNILLNCDTQPAVVYSLDPFIVSAYSDEFDAVVFLRFPEELAIIYNLFAGGDDEIRARPSIFEEKLWSRVNELTKEYALKRLSRDGFFYMK